MYSNADNFTLIENVRLGLTNAIHLPEQYERAKESLNELWESKVAEAHAIAFNESERPLDRGEYEQLEYIVYFGPVWSGDLISKTAKTALVERGYVDYLPGLNKSRTRDGIRCGGWIATDKGRAAYFAASGRTLMEEPH